MRGTVVVRLALDRATAALIVGITNETKWTGAFEGATRIAATCAGSARRVLTKIDNIATHARIATEAGLTVANLTMILCCAERILAARLSNQAGNLAHVIVTALIVGAVIVGAALDLATARASISNEALFTDAVGGMRARHALCIASTGSAAKANRFTACTSVGIQQAGFILSAVTVNAALQLLGAYVVLTELELRARGIRLAGALADAL